MGQDRRINQSQLKLVISFHPPKLYHSLIVNLPLDTSQFTEYASLFSCSLPSWPLLWLVSNPQGTTGQPFKTGKYISIRVLLGP